MASWTTTAGNIAKMHGSVATWLDRHNVDILCLQEVKATKPKLLSTPACVLNPNHWDVFLSPCTARPGLNGVATIVRKNRFRGEGISGSLPTVGADPRPFRVAELDNQGRCILTDHGAFTIINVYVPYDGELGVQLGLKIRFLEALHRLISDVQASGRSVICVGDFNVARHPRDVHYEFRKIDIANLVSTFDTAVNLCESKVGFPTCNEVLALLTLLRDKWDEIQEVLSDRKIVEIGNSNGANKGPKYVLKVGSKGVQIGPRQASPGQCEGTANPAAILTQDGFVYKPAGVMCVSDLMEVLSKLYQRTFSDQAVMAFSDVFGAPRSCPPVIEIFDKLMKNCKLVDTYIHANPAGRDIGSERFTCWDQYRNDRYENKGARIDYVFTDPGVIDAVRLVETEQVFDDPCSQGMVDGEHMSPFALSSERGRAHGAATAQGRWRPVPFGGGGIDTEPPSVAARDFEFTFSNPPQTGIVYTAPLFSDHVATSCVLDLSKLRTEGISDRLTDSLGQAWQLAMAEAIVASAPGETSKSHSLKDMFAKAASRKRKDEAPVEVIELDDSFEEEKKQKLDN